MGSSIVRIRMLPTPTQIIDQQNAYEKAITEPQIKKLMNQYQTWIALDPNNYNAIVSGLYYLELLTALKNNTIIIPIEGYNEVSVELFTQRLQQIEKVICSPYTICRGHGKDSTLTKAVKIELTVYTPNFQEILGNWQTIVNNRIQADVAILMNALTQRMSTPKPLSTKPEAPLDPNRPMPQFSVNVSDSFDLVIGIFIDKVNRDPHWSAVLHENNRSVIVAPKQAP